MLKAYYYLNGKRVNKKNLYKIIREDRLQKMTGEALDNYKQSKQDETEYNIIMGNKLVIKIKNN